MGSPFLQRLKALNLLSFDELDLDLQSLNVLIGPNSSGKSNLLEVLALLQATERRDDLTDLIRGGGGIADWLWKGASGPTASVEVELRMPERSPHLRYWMAFRESSSRLEVVDEGLEDVDKSEFYYRQKPGKPVVRFLVREHRLERRLDRLDPHQSVLAQLRDPQQYPELAFAAESFGAIRLYRDWAQGRFTAPRSAQRPDGPGDFLNENASNLPLVLDRLQRKEPDAFERIQQNVRQGFPYTVEARTHIDGGMVQVFAREKGLREAIPATRLADGFLRYLCLLVVLLHPDPPPVICLDEPEIGLHPDLINSLGRLLCEASERTQLFVTTHSDVLISAITDVSSVIVCERGEKSSQFRRLDPDKLSHWREQYTLGELWLTGEIGGVLR